MNLPERPVVSAAEEHEGQQLVGDVGGGHGGHLGVIVGRGDLAGVWLAVRTTAAGPEG